MCVSSFNILFFSSLALSNSPKLATSSTTLIMGTKQLQLVVMPLGAREASSFVAITLTSHGGSSCNNCIAANIETLNIQRK